ncbi:MAG: phenylalanine--tRNA ligase subunit beta [Gemmatimonadaceae bacterium]
MLYSHEWLKAFVAHEHNAEATRELITAHVATVDRVVRLGDELRDIVVARVVEAARHPNADRLWITRVDDGSGTLLDVVCGAPNVEVGALYPFARTGTTLPTGTTIEKRTIRGLMSNGMLCSARELTLGEDQDGILALDVAAEPGTALLDALPLGDVQFDVDVLPNRPDLLSHVGMARELAALTGAALQLPAEVRGHASAGAVLAGASEASSAGVRVAVADPTGCPRYMGLVLRGVRVGASPDWLVRRLAAIGLRSICNVVDITNYVLHGFGQPTHAFDLARLRGPSVIIRRARDGETIVTLDGVSRTLGDNMTVIADAERAIAVAGVMGGNDSEVNAATTDVFLEVAYFDPARVRRTRKALGLSTDASYRFERGIDPAITPLALDIAAGLLVRVAGGRIDGSPVDIGKVAAAPAAVALRPRRIEELLGDAIPAAETERLLRSVGFTVQPAAGGSLLVTPPSWRGDVARECDLAEEVARLRGYDALPDVLRPGRPSSVPDHPLYGVAGRVRDRLVSLGYLEAAPMPFVAGDDTTHVRVANPLAENEPHLRTAILETLAKRAEYNLTRLQRSVRLFEIGAVFAPRSGALPLEEIRVGVVALGARQPTHFSMPNATDFDAWDAKALALEIAEAAWPGSSANTVPASAGDNAVLWQVQAGGGPQPAGSVRLMALDLPAWAAQPYGVEISLGTMPSAIVAPPGQHAPSAAASATGAAQRASSPIPETPPAEFDLALVVPHDLPAARIEEVIARAAGDLLERLDLFDVYEGPGLPAAHRSIAWRLTLRDPTRTLRDKEIEGRRQRILRSLDQELGVKPRTSDS